VTNTVGKSQKNGAPGAFLLSLQASGFAVMVLVLLVTGVIVLSPTLSILAEQQQEISSLETALQVSQQEVFDLEEQRERWKDPAFVETQARERLLFVYPGDITYLVIDDVGEDAVIRDIAVSTTLLAASTDWREALLASYLVAATTSRGGPPPGNVTIPSPGEPAP
jgi:cell division protein FtsB